MCIFSRELLSVSKTRIFACRSHGIGQFLVYSMSYKADAELAMILPLPTVIPPREDAITFIDLSEYPEFFDDMASGFPQPRAGPATTSIAVDSVLAVHEVGSFEASFVPQRADFARLDERFRLPELVWDQLPAYRDFGFAVFKLKPDGTAIHPLAFKFPRRDPSTLFFPTVHVHEGRVEPMAHFDHVLFCQSSTEADDWQATPQSANAFMDMERSQQTVDPDLPIQKRRIYGAHANKDVLLVDVGIAKL